MFRITKEIASASGSRPQGNGKGLTYVSLKLVLMETTHNRKTSRCGQSERTHERQEAVMENSTSVLFDHPPPSLV